MMRNLFILGLLVLGAFMAGWFQVNRDGETTTIEINRDEIRSDAQRAITRGREFLDNQEQQYADNQQRPVDQAAGWVQQQWQQARQQAQTEANQRYQGQQPRY